MNENERRILITGAGGPAAQSLLTHRRLARLELHAADADSEAPGLLLQPAARRHLVPRGDDSGFVDRVLEVCEREGVGVVWPTVDAELLALAERRREFSSRGIVVMVSAASSLRKVLDKGALMQALTSTLPLAEWSIFDEDFDAASDRAWILKPRFGAGSRGIEFHPDATSLLARERDAAYLAQEHLPGREYSVDMFNARDGYTRCLVVRTRTRTDSGVSTLSRVVDEPEIASMARVACRTLGLHGVINLQFRRDVNGRARMLEINPRVPGGLPLSVAAGCDLPWYAYLDATGRELPEMPRPREMMMIRTFANHFRPVQETQQAPRVDRSPLASMGVC